MIEISSETVQRVESILSGVPKGAERALTNAINRGVSRVKTSAMRRVKAVYTVQSSALTAATKTKVQKADAGSLIGSVSFNGAKIPLYKFSVTPKVPGTGQAVYAAVKRGGGGTSEEGAFIATMGSTGHVGVFERVKETRFPIKERMGLAAAQMVENEQVMPQIEEEAQEVVNQRIEHEIERLLNGYGG